MKSEVNVAPYIPLPDQLKAIKQTAKPLIESGALWMAPKHAPKFAELMARWKFAVAGLIWFSAVRYPNRLALVDDEGELTYTELRDRAFALSRSMMDRGMTEQSAFGVIARNGRGIILPMAMKGYVGAEIMLMNIGSSPEQIEGLIEQNDVKYLFIDEEFLPQLPENQGDCKIVVSHLENPDDRSGLPEGALVMSDLVEEGLRSETKIPRRPKQGRIIIMSSGTTGLPKGILRDEPKTPSTLGAIADRIPWRRNMVVHQSASMFHAWGWANVIIAMVTGATLVTQRHNDSDRFVELCERYRVNGLVSAAVWLQKFKDGLDKRPDAKVGPFNFIVTSGNATPPWLVQYLTRKFGPVVCNFYGSTEAGATTIATGPEMARNPETAGRPVIGAQVVILDDNNNPVPAGQIGRIHTVQELSFNGYLSEKDKFRTVEGRYEIGDLGRIDEDGYLYICGRSDDMIIRGGENVFPREVEEFVSPLEGVYDVFARGVDTDEVIAGLHLYVVRTDNEAGQALTDESLKEAVTGCLASWSVPDEVIFVDELPRNAAGKVVPRYLDAKLRGEQV